MPVHRTERKKFKSKHSRFEADEAVKKKAVAEYEGHKLASVLAQIDLASCFRNEKEPLFDLLSPVIYAALKK